MKKQIIFLISIILLSTISAQIIIQEQPEKIYNVGEIIETSFKLTTSTDLNPNSFFSTYLLCNGIETQVMQIPVGNMKAGEEKAFEIPIPILKEILGRTTGTCKIKSTLGSIEKEEYEYILSENFDISDKIVIKIEENKTSFFPEEKIILEGEALRKNGKPVQGTIEIKVIEKNNSVIEKIDTVKNGYFYLDFSLPKETKAGKYLVKVDIYEINSKGEKTNTGSTNYNIQIKQVPTNLELILENNEIEPGTNLKLKTILHDQTGESIKSESNITIKNENGDAIKQEIKKTEEFFEFPIKYNEAPAKWEVIAYSNELKTESNFEIKEKQNVEVSLINKTLIIANKGNVPYNKSVEVKIGNDTLKINVTLAIDEEKKYTLKAPDGKYQIEVLADKETKMNRFAILTGKAVEVKEAGKGISTLAKHPLVWIFIITILGAVAFLIFKKGHKKVFFGHAPKDKKQKIKKNKKEPETQEYATIPTKNKAQLSLSIKGNKENADIICLKLKNFNEIKSNAKETLEKIIASAEEKKAYTYENQDSLFFILTPTKTKTFKNEENAIKIAQKIEEKIKEHNKLFKQKIEFGISLNYGAIITKQQEKILEFMSMGTLITTAKRIASASNGEILLSQRIKEKLGSNIKTIKEQKNNLEFYKIKEIKDREKNKKFIQKFVQRLEKDKEK